MSNHSENRYRRNIKDPVIIPYNVNNKLIKDVDLKEMMNNYNIKLEIINIEIYRTALTHKSYIKKEFYNRNSSELKKAKIELGNVLELRNESNERLEFLGDTVIKSIIAEYLFERYPTEDEGFMTRLKTKIENRESLARFARIIGLDEFVIISAQNEDSNTGRTNDKILEDVFESFMAALYLDKRSLKVWRCSSSKLSPSLSGGRVESKLIRCIIFSKLEVKRTILLFFFRSTILRSSIITPPPQSITEF